MCRVWKIPFFTQNQKNCFVFMSHRWHHKLCLENCEQFTHAHSNWANTWITWSTLEPIELDIKVHKVLRGISFYHSQRKHKIKQIGGGGGVIPHPDERIEKNLQRYVQTLMQVSGWFIQVFLTYLLPVVSSKNQMNRRRRIRGWGGGVHWVKNVPGVLQRKENIKLKT